MSGLDGGPDQVRFSARIMIFDTSARYQSPISLVPHGLFRSVELFQNAGINSRHDLFGHHNHGLPTELAILPILACIQ